MARNVEIKACVSSIVDLEKRVALLATDGPYEILQDDTFFKCNKGRLELREFANGSGQLIFYRRTDEREPKESFDLISETLSPSTLRGVLSIAYGDIGRVKKKRLLYGVGKTRVHPDLVENLGQFVELEVVLNHEDSAEKGVEEALSLMEQIGIHDSQPVEGAYLDLLSRPA